MTMPTVTHKQERISDVGQVESSTTDQQDIDEEMYDDDWAAKQIDNLVTLSNLPSSRWQHLLKLDVIKVNQIKSDCLHSHSRKTWLPYVYFLVFRRETSHSTRWSSQCRLPFFCRLCPP